MDDSVAGYVERAERKYWGKYRGTVADRGDPEQLGRLKVRVPSLLGDAVTGWAWPAVTYAGAGIGLLALPLVGDLVWVEFMEGELDHPIWSGASWAKPAGSSEVPAPGLAAYPDVVVLRTPSGHEVILSDQDGSELLTIRAASGCEVVLDPNANTVTIRAGEVLVRSGQGDVEPLATKSFVQQVFDQHVHATGVGPSGPPQPTSTPSSITTVLKAE
jgi:uncharacterized protein involved in type VI secretion and phage assembly